MEEIKNHESEIMPVLDKTITAETISGKDALKKLSEVIVNETDIDEENAEKIVSLISKTIDTVDENYQDLQEFKENGGSTSEWLQGKLEDIDKNFPGEEDDVSAKQVLDTLVTANKEMADELCEQYGIEKIPNPALNTKTFGEYIDLNKKKYLDAIKNETANNSLYDILNFERGKLKLSKDDKENPLIKKYFQDPLDAPDDKNMKKAVSVAAVIAREKDLLPKDIIHKTEDELSLIVDKGLTSAKVAYKVANEELNPVDAVEYVIDRNVSIINSAIVTKSTLVGGKVGSWVGEAIGSIFGPTGSALGASIGNVVGKAAGYGIGKVVGEGIKKIGGAIKSVASSAWEGIKSVASSIQDDICSFFGW